MVRIELQLPPEQANIVWEAMFTALDSGRREAAEQDAGAPAEARGELDPADMEAERADALVSVAQAYEILDVGRARRTIPSAIGRALRLRDGGCRVPGCGRRHHLHAHHIEAWVEGGKTSKSNLVLLCPSHHTLVHEGQLSVDVRDGKLEFRNAYGLEICAAPRRVHDREEPDRWWRDTPKVDRFPLWDGAPMDLEYVMNSSLAGL
jgi:hypothetical protein